MDKQIGALTVRINFDEIGSQLSAIAYLISKNRILESPRSRKYIGDGHKEVIIAIGNDNYAILTFHESDLEALIKIMDDK